MPRRRNSAGSGSIEQAYDVRSGPQTSSDQPYGSPNAFQGASVPHTPSNGNGSDAEDDDKLQQKELDALFFAPSSPPMVGQGRSRPEKGRRMSSSRQMLNRPPSDLATEDAEGDDLFPMLSAPLMNDTGSNESRSPHLQTDDHSDEPPELKQHPHQQARAIPSGIPGQLPYIPYAFDFDTLEEFAAKERESTGYFSSKAAAKGESRGQGLSVSFSPENGSEVRRRHGDDGHKQGRMGRMRKLSESVATPGGRAGRYQRKLALFEGATGDATASLAGRLALPATDNAHSRTPLLDHKDPRPFGSMGAHPRGTPGLDEKDRPYRFSFYSNGLPSTVHTRHLSDLPNDGQSYEEMFTGHKPEVITQQPVWDDSTTAADDAPAQTPSASNSNRNSVSGIPGGVGGLRAQLLSGQQPASSGASQAGRESQKTKPALMHYDRNAADLEANTWWLDVLCPTDAEMKCISKVFGIHPLTTEDIQMEESREKIELFRNYYFVCFRSFDQDPYSPTYLEPLNMYIVVLREGTLSFHFRGTPHPQNVRRRIKQLKDFINVSSDWISYALIDDITDAFGPLIQNIEYEVDSIDELVLILKEAEQSDMLRRIGTCRKKVMGLLRLIGQKADVVKGLAKRCNENWSVAPKSDIGLYLSDIQDHLVTMTQNLNHYEKILSRSHSNYLAQISIEMTDANNAINEVLSKLTALGTVLVPMNLITGLWGMNVRVPGEDVQNLHWFFSIVAVLVGIAVVGGFATWKAIRK